MAFQAALFLFTIHYSHPKGSLKMHYDHISFHTDEPDYPSDLPERNAAHHMGFYYAWAVSHACRSFTTCKLA